MYHPRGSLLLLAALLPAAAIADDSAGGGEVVEPIDVVTIIGRKADAADVPGSAHIVDSETLATFEQSDILRVLRSVPGVYVQEEEGYGLRPNIGIRGSGLDRSARIALLEDGVLIAPAPYAASSAYYFPTQRRMSAVEVLKGPASVPVGPRTTGGAVNLVSTPVPDGRSLNLDIRGGENGALDAHVNVGDSGERVSWLLETVQSQSDGFKTIGGPVGGDTGFDLQDYVLKVRVDNDAESEVRHSLSAKVGYTEQHSDETYLGLTRNDFDADPYRRYAASANDRFASEHDQFQLSYTIDPGSDWRGTVTAYRNNFERNWYKLQSVGGESLGAVLDDPATFADEYDYLTGTSSPDDALQLRANNRSYYSQGVQGRVEWDLGVGAADVLLNTGFRIHEDEEDRFQHQDGYRMDDGRLVLTTAGSGGSQTNRVSGADVRAAFVNAELRAGRWILTPGVRYEHIDLERIDYSTADPSRAAGPTRVRRNSVSVMIPGIGALYRLNPEWRLLAGVHKGYNPPAPGSTADAEESVNVEAGVRFDNTRFSVEAIAFVNDYGNLVGTVTESTGGGGQVGDQFDGGEALVRGIEFSLGASPAVGAWVVPIDLRYTWTGKAEFQNAFDSDYGPWGEVGSGDELPYIPEHQLRAMTGIESGHFRFNVAATYVDAMRIRAGHEDIDSASGIASHVVWDALGSWQFSESMSVYVKLDNAFDRRYVAAQRPSGYRPGLPRTAYLGFTLAL